MSSRPGTAADEIAILEWHNFVQILTTTRKLMNKVTCVLAAVLLAGCASGGKLTSTDALREIHALDEQMTSTISVPTPDEYHAARTVFATEMNNVADRARRKTRSPANTVRGVVGTAGAVIGIGGTVASLVIKNDDTKATVAQASGAVAGVASILSLIPFGSGTHAAKAVSTYLESALPSFEMRWPSDRREPLSAAEWRLFVHDCEQIQSTANALAGLD